MRFAVHVFTGNMPVNVHFYAPGLLCEIGTDAPTEDTHKRPAQAAAQVFSVDMATVADGAKRMCLEASPPEVYSQPPLFIPQGATGPAVLQSFAEMRSSPDIVDEVLYLGQLPPDTAQDRIGHIFAALHQATDPFAMFSDIQAVTHAACKYILLLI